MPLDRIASDIGAPHPSDETPDDISNIATETPETPSDSDPREFEPRHLGVSLDRIASEIGAQHLSDEAPDAVSGRTRPRAAAVQAMYQSDITNRPIANSMKSIERELHLNSKDRRYARALAYKADNDRAKIDRKLNRYSLNRRMDETSPIIRNILRVAIAELVVEPEISDAIVIDEAVKIAKMFDSQNAARFVNGVLGAVVRAQDESKAS